MCSVRRTEAEKMLVKYFFMCGWAEARCWFHARYKISEVTAPRKNSPPSSFFPLFYFLHICHIYIYVSHDREFMACGPVLHTATAYIFRKLCVETKRISSFAIWVTSENKKSQLALCPQCFCAAIRNIEVWCWIPLAYIYFSAVFAVDWLKPDSDSCLLCTS